MARDPSSSSSTSTPTAPRSQRRPVNDLARSNSLRLPRQPVHIPIPPSLLQSPYLNSPHSIFKRAVTSPGLPSEADEEWLQDTVPLSSEGSAHEQHPRGRSRASDHLSPANAPPSPPLVHRRQPSADLTSKSAWLGQISSYSTEHLHNIEHLKDANYFAYATPR